MNCSLSECLGMCRWRSWIFGEFQCVDFAAENAEKAQNRNAEKGINESEHEFHEKYEKTQNSF